MVFVWLRKKRCQWICASNLHIIVQTILMFKTSIWAASLSPTKKCELLSMSKYLSFGLHEIHISNAFIYPWFDKCQYVWLLLQRISLVLDGFLRIPQNNIPLNPCMTCQRSKTDSSLYRPLNTCQQSNNKVSAFNSITEDY